VSLPGPRDHGRISVETALRQRRSIREFTGEPLDLADLSQLLWAGQGITCAEEGKRTAPSAGALYPLELYVAAGAVDSLAAGIYAYAPKSHEIVLRAPGDARPALFSAAWEQFPLRRAAAVIAIAAAAARTTAKYRERGPRYVHIETGHAAENICLQAVALGLGSVVMGAFDDAAVARILGLSVSEAPVLLLPVGRPLHGPRQRRE
jgi:SagB-type dehydrogenase family enzyme